MPGAQTFLFVCCFNHFLVHFAVARRMGCAISGLAPKTAGETKTEDAVAQLSKEQIEMIKESWKVIQEDIAKVGIIMFVRLFETHPECKDVFFLFRDVEDLDRLRTSRELRAHGLRVMSFIEKSVARLDQLERLEVLAVELGRSHYRYNAPPKYYSYVGAEFICAVQPILKERWTPELEEAWKAYEPGLPGEEQTSPGGSLPQGEEHSLIRDLDGLNSELVEQA